MPKYEKKQYFMETKYKDRSLFDNSIEYKTETDTIIAFSDSAAYIEAYTDYRISVSTNNYVDSLVNTDITKSPVDFTLYDDKMKEVYYPIPDSVKADIDNRVAGLLSR